MNGLYLIATSAQKRARQYRMISEVDDMSLSFIYIFYVDKLTCTCNMTVRADAVAIFCMAFTF